MKPGRLLLAAALMTAAGIACAGPRWTESVVRVPVEGVAIEVTVFKPQGAGPFPIAVVSHGSPRSADERRMDGRQRLVAQVQPFVAMGFAVLVPTRRGYGHSGGEWAEGYGACEDADYYSAGLESARDIRAAVQAVRREPWADAARVVLAGQSAGGFGSVAAAAQPFDGLLGVINFAGGRAELVSAPPVGLDGHAYFAAAMDDWAPRVRAFLARIGALR